MAFAPHPAFGSSRVPGPRPTGREFPCYRTTGLLISAGRTGPAKQGGGRILPILSRPMLLFTLVWMGMNVIAGVTGMGVAGETALIAWQAHMGGFIAGMLLAGVFDKLSPQPVSVEME